MKNVPYLLLTGFVLFGIGYIVYDLNSKKKAREIDPYAMTPEEESRRYDSIEARRKRDTGKVNYSNYSQTEFTPYTGSYEHDIWFYAKKIIPKFTNYPLETEVDDDKYKIESNGLIYKVSGIGTSKNGYGVRIQFVYVFQVRYDGSDFELITQPTIVEE